MRNVPTRLICWRAWSTGRPTLAGELFPAAYAQLRDLAEAVLKGERPHQTLHATALVHEAYLRLVDFQKLDWRGRAQFGAIASKAMRSVLVDHARARNADKRGGGWDRITLAGLQEGSDPGLDVLQLDDALEKLQEEHERHARSVEMRYFGGMSRAEIAEALGVSERTVTADLAFAQAWLRRQMDSGSEAR